MATLNMHDPCQCICWWGYFASKPQVNFTWQFSHFLCNKSVNYLFLSRCHFCLTVEVLQTEGTVTSVLQLMKEHLRASVMITVVNIFKRK